MAERDEDFEQWSERRIARLRSEADTIEADLVEFRRLRAEAQSRAALVPSIHEEQHG